MKKVNSRIAIVAVTAALALTSMAAPTAAQSVREIPAPWLPDIAMATADEYGPVIYYSPQLCSTVGSLVCEFYRAHEYGHINLGHVLRPNHPAQMEFEADCWAARYVSPSVFQAAYQWFVNGGGSTPVHGSGQQRASRIIACRDAVTTR